MIRHLLASLRFYRRSHLGVLLGSLLAAAVLTGSLLVGDSVEDLLGVVPGDGSVTQAITLSPRFSSTASAGLSRRGVDAMANGRGPVRLVLKHRHDRLGHTLFGEMTEWPIVRHWKCRVLGNRDRGFESPSLRSSLASTLSGR